MRIDIPWTRFKRLAQLVRLRPYDLTTEEGRSLERHRRVLLSAATAFAAKLISIAGNLVAIPFTLHYLGSERFGLWMTITAFNLMMAFTDLGIGNGLLSAIADRHGRLDRENMRADVSSAIAVLAGIGGLILVLYLSVGRYVPWADVLNIHSEQARHEAPTALEAFAICFALRVPLDAIQKIELGLQMGFAANLWQMLSSVTGFLGLFLAIGLRGGVPALVLASVGAPLVFSIANYVWFFLWARRDLFPSWRSVSRPRATRLARAGFLFFVLQCAASVTFAADPIIVARTLGQHVVADYSVLLRLFDFVPLLISIGVLPLWPAYGEARSRGDVHWIIRTLKLSMVLTFSGILPAVLVATLWGNQILTLWVGLHPTYSIGVLCAFGVWAILKTLGGTFAMFLNGTGVIRMQLVVSVICATCSIFVKVWATRAGGLAGLMLAMTAVYTVCIALPYLFSTPRLLARLTHESTS